MDWNMVENNWAHFQWMIKARWGRLTGDRLDAIEGKRGQLIGKIQEIYGLSAEAAELQVQDFELRNRDYRPSTSSCSKWRVVG